MKKLISILLLFLLLSVLLNSWSGVISNQITDFIGPIQESKTLLSANLQIQRAMVSSSLSLATAEKSFINEAIERVRVAIKLIPKNNRDLKIKLQIIKKRIEVIQEKMLNNNTVSKEELLNLALIVEQLGQKLNKDGRSTWGVNLDLFNDLISNYKRINWAIRTFQAVSLLLFIYLIYSLYHREKIQAAIQNKEKLHGLLFSSLSEAVFLCSPDGTIKSCNYSAGLLANRTPQELINNQIFDSISEERFSRKDQIDNLKDLISKGESYSGLIATAKVDGKDKWLSINTQPITKDSGANSFQIILSIRDITKGIKAEKVIKDQQALLVESAKLQSIGEMAGGIAHEINNPLTIISTTSSRLSRKASRADSIDSKEIKTVTDKIATTVDRMAKIIRSLLAMSRGETDQSDSVKVGEIINIALDFCYPLLEKSGVELIVNQVNSDINIDCHVTQISQVLLNLVKNSIDAIQELPEKWIEIKTIDEVNFIRIEVTDSGTGIPQELQEQILLPFYTTKALGKGTGLGLSISRKIVEIHGGTFGIDTTTKNTCFYMKLPKERSKEEQPTIMVKN